MVNTGWTGEPIAFSVTLTVGPYVTGACFSGSEWAFRDVMRSDRAFIGSPWAKPSSQNAHVHVKPRRLARHPALRMRVRSGYRFAMPLQAPPSAPARVDRDVKPGNASRTRERVPVRSRPGAR